MKTLDTRDLYKRKCELEELRDAVTTAREELDQIATSKPDEDEGLAAFEAWEKEKEDAESNLESADADFGDDEKTELDELETLENEISEFMHGETMILENDFEDYAREMAEDTHGKAVREATWPFTCIDWEQAARELARPHGLSPASTGSRPPANSRWTTPRSSTKAKATTFATKPASQDSPAP